MFQKSCVEKIETHFTFKFFFEDRAIYGIKWKKYGTAGEATDDNVIRRTRVTC